MASDSPAPFFFAAVIEGRIEPDIFNQFSRLGKTLDVADDGPQSEGHLVPDAAQSSEGQQQRVGQDFLGDEAAPVRSLFFGVAPFHEVTADHLFLADRPGAGLENACLVFLAMAEVGCQAHAIIAQIREEAIAHLGGPFDTLAMRVEPITPLLRFEVWNPNFFGGARQIGFANAHGADLIIIGVSFLQFAHLATLQDQRFALDRRQASDYLEAVTGGLQHEEILGAGVLLGPTLELGHRHFVKHFLGHRCSRSWSPEQRRREGVRVGVKTDHPLDKRCIIIHLFVFFVMQADGNGSGDYMHSGMRGGPHVGAFRRCSFTETENYSKWNPRASSVIHLLVSSQQVLRVIHFPSVLQLLPECFRTPDTNLIPSQRAQRADLSALRGSLFGVPSPISPLPSPALSLSPFWCYIRLTMMLWRHIGVAVM